MYKVQLFPSLVIDASCTKHDQGNAAKAAHAASKKTRAPFPELDDYSTTTSAQTFVIRKFKRTSNYPHQKSWHLTAHIYSKHGRKAMLFGLYIFQNFVYCRGQRELNLMANNQWMLLLVSYGFMAKINDVTYDGSRILSRSARAIIGPLMNHKHIQNEMVMNGMLFHCIFYPLVRIMSGQAVKAKQEEVIKIIDTARDNTGLYPHFLLTVNNNGKYGHFC